MTDKTLEKLTLIIKDRMKRLPDDSYVSKLYKKGEVKIANKLGEEAVETISAFLTNDKNEVIEESADLLFHLLVLLEFKGIELNAVISVLKKRMKND
ncbi:MAG: phosphoribosyl-ATP diphosphatase [Alphaproteobacteria bacterium]